MVLICVTCLFMKDRKLFKCNECDHEWFSKTFRPVKCPSCKSYHWDYPVQQLTYQGVPMIFDKRFPEGEVAIVNRPIKNEYIKHDNIDRSNETKEKYGKRTSRTK